MKSQEYQRVESLLNLIGKENSPKLNTLLEACGMNNYSKPGIFIFTNDYKLTSKQQFLNDWLIYNNYESYKEQLLQKYGLNNKTVANYFKEPFNSGYSMGETECIIIKSEFDSLPIELHISVHENIQKYAGKHRDFYNYKAKYGERILLVTVKNNRAKYELKEIKK